MGRILLSASAIFIGLLALCDGAVAASASKVLDGKALDIRAGCVSSVEIEPHSDLASKITVEASADRADEIEALTFGSGDTAKIERRGSCIDHDKITLVLKVGVPAGTPLDIANSGSGDYRVGDVGGPLKVLVSGSGAFKGGNFTAVDLTISGSSDASLAHIDGPAHFTISGTGNIKIGTAQVPSMKITVSGTGKVELASGVIGTLAASVTGPGGVTLHATADTAALSTTGPGSIAVDKITGTVAQHSVGPGSIRIGG